MRQRRRQGAVLVVIFLLGCPGMGHGPGGPPGPPLPDLSFGTLDANEDGTLDPEEFQRFADALFARLDDDRDGQLNRTEYRSLRRRPRGGAFGRAPGGPTFPPDDS